jgi:6-phosphogluconate dehydrogenase
VPLSPAGKISRRPNEPGGIVGSRHLNLMAQPLAANSDLSNHGGYVQDSSEGRWTIQAAIEEGVSATVPSAARYARFRSREEQSFPDKMLSAMRHGFGDHVELQPGA